MKEQLTLAIESSCDETAAAVYSSERGILSNILFSQTAHVDYGGVVPEIASRIHVQKIESIVKQALIAAQCSLEDINYIGVTCKPGLSGSLLVGLCFAKALSFARSIQLVGVDHLEGHAFSSSLEHTLIFPYLCITASGGHTSLYIIKDWGDYQIIGQTLDDAAGEAFDKIAKLLALPYPGGPYIEQYAQEVGFVDFHHYPRAKKGLDFSFSGLKTAILYQLVEQNNYDLNTKILSCTQEEKKRVASSMLVCIKDIFIKKLELALLLYPNCTAISFVGGVACNRYLKNAIKTLCDTKNIFFASPSAQYCTDNAAMIALVANYKAAQNKFDDLALDIF